MSAGTTTGFPEVGLVLQLAALGGACAGGTCSDTDLRTVADIIEELLTSDDSSVADAIATGFIEANLHHGEWSTGSRAPAEWLGPQARADIAAYDDFCGRVARDGRERR